MLKTRKSLLLFLIVLAFSAGGWKLTEFLPSSREIATPVTIGAKARAHILYGDARGGGHLHGADKPCKSEFPARWNAAKVISHVEAIAANDNAVWRPQRNGYSVTEEMVEDVKVRVVIDRARGRVVTAYPVNVARNPCPPANDNLND